MRIPVRALKILRREDGNVVLELRPAFASVDPIIVELPESELTHVGATLDAFTQAAGFDARTVPAPAPERTADGKVIATGVDVDSLFAGNRYIDAKSAANLDETGLTEEELDWLARSAG